SLESGFCYGCVFFFSSRRRHTRFSRDWSSDVCSSDLPSVDPRDAARGTTRRAPWDEVLGPAGPDVVGPAVSDDLGAGPSGGEESGGGVGGGADGAGRAPDEGGAAPAGPGGGGRGPVGRG